MREELEIAKNIKDFLDTQDLRVNDGQDPIAKDFLVNIIVTKKTKDPGFWVGNLFLKGWTQKDWLAIRTRLDSRLAKLGPDKIRKALTDWAIEHAWDNSPNEAREDLADCIVEGQIGLNDRTDEEIEVLFIQELCDLFDGDPDNNYSYNNVTDEELDEYFESLGGE